jgi:hypothetical protein
MAEDKVSKSSYSPSFGIRLLWWFGIYFAAQLPLIPWALKMDWRLWPLFPMAMEWGFVCFVGALMPHMPNNPDGSITSTRQAIENCIWTVAIIFPWATYISHFVCTLRVRKRRSFLILMWILGGILISNLASCAYFFHAPPA